MEKGIKFDHMKPDYSLVPAFALNEVVKVFTYGAHKYSRNNWQFLDDCLNRYFAAAQRHQWQYKSGELNDGETNISHIAHAIASLMFILEYRHINKMDSTSQQLEFNF